MTELHNLVHSCIDNMSSEKRDFHIKMVSDDIVKDTDVNFFCKIIAIQCVPDPGCIIKCDILFKLHSV